MTAVGVLARNLPPDTSPRILQTLLEPRLMESCFQTAGQWEIEKSDRMCLPQAVGSATVYRHPESGEGDLYALVVAREESDGFDAQIVDEAGQVYVAMEGYRTIQLPRPAKRERH